MTHTSNDPLFVEFVDTISRLQTSGQDMNPVLHGRRRHLEDRATWESARIPADAMLQLVVLRSVIEDLCERTDIDDAVADSLMNAGYRLCDSVLSFISDAHGIERDQLPFSWYHSARMEAVARGEGS